MLFCQPIDFLRDLAAPVVRDIEFLRRLSTLDVQLYVFFRIFVIFDLKIDQKINNFAKNEKVFFTEKTRAAVNFNLDFCSFFRFLGWPPAENNRLGDTFSI